ncbi:unnamed protein product [Didymodactylos carnosus]|uniref:Phospholipase A2-like central domain-containing protein n=1 Tax=Didymodactylos carnosus TaxID=1234261 RepID=A0A814UXC7_9BILA|nr:unnamed protein product [Didymodactylos carnosus]CAF3944852.1 unnamed protein product [Didymodactylos carnosus]
MKISDPPFLEPTLCKPEGINALTTSDRTSSYPKASSSTEREPSNAKQQLTLTIRSDHVQNFSDLEPNNVLLKSIVSDVNNEEPHRYDKSIAGSILQPVCDKNLIFSYVIHGDLNAVQQVLQDHREVVHMKNSQNQTLLHVVVIYVLPYVYIRLLLMSGVDPCAQDHDGYTAAHYAVEKDNVEMLKALTVRFHPQVKTFSDRQVYEIHKNCVRALSIRENHGGLIPFMLACYKQSINCARYIQRLQMDQMDVNTQDRFGDTSLHYAVARNNMDLTTLLIVEFKADVNGGNSSRPSSLDIAVFNHHSELKELLLVNNAKSRCLIKRIMQKRKDMQHDIEGKLEELTIGDAPISTTLTGEQPSCLSCETDSPEPKKKKSIGTIIVVIVVLEVNVLFPYWNSAEDEKTIFKTEYGLFYLLELEVQVALYVPEGRNLLQFGSLIQHVTNTSALNYIGYGCWCGFGGSGQPMDATDECCKNHDHCYEKYDTGMFGCFPYTATYAWKVDEHTGTVQCVDQEGTCKYNVCMCDKTVSECYHRNLATFNVELVGKCPKQ